jgi:hypothetical protein
MHFLINEIKKRGEKGAITLREKLQHYPKQRYGEDGKKM